MNTEFHWNVMDKIRPKYTDRNYAYVSLCPSQTSHGLTWGRNRKPTLTGQRLTACAVVRNLKQEICVNIICNFYSHLNVHSLQFPVTEALRVTILKYLLTETHL